MALNRQLIALAVLIGTWPVIGAATGMTSVADAQGLTAARQTRPGPTPDAPVAVEINWDAARADLRSETARRAETRSQLAVRQAPTFPQPRNFDPEALARTQVPVLVPSYGALSFTAEPLVLFFPRGDFYTLSIAGEGVTIEVFCTRLAHYDSRNSVAARRLRGSGPDSIRSERTEYGREVSFNRYRAAYSVTIECDDPVNDPRCSAPGYGDALVQSLQVLPGSVLPNAGGG